MKPLKVLVHSSGREIGGVERHIFLLLKHLDRERFLPTLMHEDSTDLEPWLRQIDALEVPRIVRSFRRMSDVSKIPAMADWLRRERFDIIHSHLDQRYISLAGWLAETPAVVWTYHVRIPQLKPYQYWLDHASLRLSRGKVAAVSEALRKHLIQSGFCEQEISVVPCGLEPVGSAPPEFDREAMRRTLGVNSTETLALTPARMTEQKGHTYLIRAIALLKESASASSLKFAFAGDGPLRADLEREAEALGVREKIIFLGFREDVNELLWASDFLVLPSLWEGLPLVLMEALSAGKACVCSDVDGNSEAIEHEKTGLLVPPRDPEALAKVIANLVDNPPLMMRMQQAGSDVFAQRFHVGLNVERIQRIYLQRLFEAES